MSADFDFITDRLAVGNVASRAVPGFVAVVSLLSTRPWDELHGAPIVPRGIRLDAVVWSGRGSKFRSTEGQIAIWHIDIGDGETKKPHPGTGETYGHDLDEYLDDVTAFIAAHIARGCVLVHCGAGISRSVAIVVAYLCRYAGMSYDEALAFVRSKRPQAAPCDAFAAAVKRWLRLDYLTTTGPRR